MLAVGAGGGHRAGRNAYCEGGLIVISIDQLSYSIRVELSTWPARKERSNHSEELWLWVADTVLTGTWVGVTDACVCPRRKNAPVKFFRLAKVFIWNSNKTA